MDVPQYVTPVLVESFAKGRPPSSAFVEPDISNDVVLKAPAAMMDFVEVGLADGNWEGPALG